MRKLFTGKRTLSWMLMMLMLMSVAFGAAAETCVLPTTQSFVDYLDSRGISYTYTGMDEDGDERVNVSYNLDNYPSQKVNLFFDGDGDAVSLRMWNIITASAGKNYILSTLNELNADYKFAKFVLDESDSTVQAEMDMYITEDSGERVCDAMLAMFVIVDNDEIAQKLLALQ